MKSCASAAFLSLALINLLASLAWSWGEAGRATTGGEKELKRRKNYDHQEVCAQEKAQLWGNTGAQEQRRSEPARSSPSSCWSGRKRRWFDLEQPVELLEEPELRRAHRWACRDAAEVERELQVPPKLSTLNVPVTYKSTLHDPKKLTFQHPTHNGNNMSHGERIPRVQPLFKFKGDRDLSSPAAQAARLRLDSHTVQFYDFFYDIYQRGRIVPTFRQNLSQAQSQYLIFVTQLSDWTDSDDAVTFQQEVDMYRFMSFDLEQMKPDKEAVERVPLFKRRRIDQDRCVYAIFGTITGRVVIFDLEECYGGPVSTDDPLVTLPPEFRAWCKSPDVIITGSGVDRDLEEAGVEAQKVINMQTVFSKHLVACDGEGPLVDLGNNRRSGLGIQAYYAKDLDYKPMPARKYIDSYGPHRYRDAQGKLKWPAWRHHDHLYRWYKDREGNLRPESLFYMWHDGSCPASVVAKLFLDTCQRRPIVIRQSTVAEYLDAFLGPDYVRVGGLEVLHIDEPALEEELWEDAEVQVVREEVAPKQEQEQVSHKPVDEFSTGKAQTALYSRNWRKGRSWRTRSKWLTSNLRRRSAERESPAKEPCSPTGTGAGSGRIHTSQAPVLLASVSTVLKVNIPTSTKVEQSCARRRWRTNRRTRSARIPAVRTRKRTASLPARCFSTAAECATTEAMTRRPAAGTGRTTSGRQPEMTSRPTPTSGFSPRPGGETNAGAGGATFGGPHSRTSRLTRHSWTWTGERLMRSWVSGRGSRGQTDRGASPSGTRLAVGEEDSTEDGSAQGEREEDRRERVVKRKERLASAVFIRRVLQSSRLKRSRAFIRIIRAVSRVVFKVFISRLCFIQNIFNLYYLVSKENSLVITRVLLVPVAFSKQNFVSSPDGLVVLLPLEVLQFKVFGSWSVSRRNCDQRLRRSPRSSLENKAPPSYERTFKKKSSGHMENENNDGSALRSSGANNNKVLAAVPGLRTTGSSHDVTPGKATADLSKRKNKQLPSGSTNGGKAGV